MYMSVYMCIYLMYMSVYVCIYLMYMSVYVCIYLMVHIFPIMLQERPARETEFQPIPRKVNLQSRMISL